MNKFIEWIAKFFGHIDVHGLEAMAIKGLQALLVLLVSYWVSRIIQRIIVRSIKNDKNAVRTYRTAVRYVVMPLGFVMALHIMGLNLSTFFHTGGLVAIAVAFAMKDVANNLVSILSPHPRTFCLLGLKYLLVESFWRQDKPQLS